MFGAFLWRSSARAYGASKLSVSEPLNHQAAPVRPVARPEFEKEQMAVSIVKDIDIYRHSENITTNLAKTARGRVV